MSDPSDIIIVGAGLSGLLAAVALMAAGWDGAESDAPGFPKEGWVVRHEGLAPLP